MKIYLLACLAGLVLLQAVPGQCQEAIYPPDEDDSVNSSVIRDEEVIDVDYDEDIDVGRMLVSFLDSSDDDNNSVDDGEEAEGSDREGRNADLSEVITDPLLTEKYNKFVDAVVSRMSMMMRLNHDPMRIVIRKSGKVALESENRNKNKGNRNKENRNKGNRNKRNRNKNKNKNNGRKNSNRRRGINKPTERRHPKDLAMDDIDVGVDVEYEREENAEGLEDEVEGVEEMHRNAEGLDDESEDEVEGKDQEDERQEQIGLEDEQEEDEQQLDETYESEMAPRKKREIVASDDEYEDDYDYGIEDEDDDYVLEDGRSLDDADYVYDEYDDEYDDAEDNEIKSSDALLRDGRELEEEQQQQQQSSDIKVEEENDSDVEGRNRRRRKQAAAARRRRRRKGGKRRKGKCGKRCRRRRKAMRRRIRRRNKSKKRRRGTRGKRSAPTRRGRPSAVFSGMSRIKRHGDVRITQRANSQNIAADLEFGPMLLKAEKKFGGANQEVRRAEALAANVKGEMVINVNKDGTASVRKLRILRPESVQVSGNLRRKPSKSSDNFMQAYILKSRSLIVRKMKAVASKILTGTNISDQQVEKM